MQHSLARVHPAGSQLLIGVKQQNAILGHNPNHHDEAHKAGHVEVRACNQQGEHNTCEREDGTGQNGNRSSKVTKLRQQYAEDQGERQHQNAREIAERPLLLLISASVFDPNLPTG
jgi:hypothetical protein